MSACGRRSFPCSQVSAERPSTNLQQSLTRPLADTVYLDYAASPPAPPAAVQSFLADMTSHLYSNPHSRSTSSAATSIAIDRVRGRILTELCGLSAEASKQWDVVFTSGTTASIKLVGDAFSWRAEARARLRYLKQSHTSSVPSDGSAYSC